MKVIKRYNQHRRDLRIDIECENCKSIEKDKSAYDDRNFWDNVVPSWECKKCNKSSNDLNVRIEKNQTRYPDGMQV